MAVDNVDQVTPIELSPSNLFNKGQQLVFSDGTGILNREQIDHTPKEGDAYHTVKNTDTLYSIAYDFYNEIVEIPSRWWWAIADANPTLIFNPMDLSDLVGDEILIPDLTNFRLINT